MRYRGIAFEYLEESGPVFEAIVTETRIVIDWKEGGDTLHLQATSRDGLTFEGNYGVGHLDTNYFMELRLFTSKNKEVLLVGMWHILDDDEHGRTLFVLKPEQIKNPQRGRRKK